MNINIDGAGDFSNEWKDPGVKGQVFGQYKGFQLWEDAPPTSFPLRPLQKAEVSLGGSPLHTPPGRILGDAIFFSFSARLLLPEPLQGCSIGRSGLS